MQSGSTRWKWILDVINTPLKKLIKKKRDDDITADETIKKVSGAYIS